MFSSLCAIFINVSDELGIFQSCDNPFDDDDNGKAYFNIAVNDTVMYHNKSHFFKTKYKTVADLNVNWNKKNIHLAYLILKAYPKIDDESGKRRLLQQKDATLIPNVSYQNSLNDNVAAFIANIICRNIKNAEDHAAKRTIERINKELRAEISSEVQTDILDDEFDAWFEGRHNDMVNDYQIAHFANDYVRMCMQSKKKINLNVKSSAQISNLHDDFSRVSNHYRSNTKVVSVPKNTKFKVLREMLPDSFEWIKTRKRLILETELQNHCVWSYADKISSDMCAIYSFVDRDAALACDGKARRYTIEFMRNHDDTYHIVQVQGKNNRVNTQKVRAHIQDILDRAAQERKQREEENKTKKAIQKAA